MTFGYFKEGYDLGSNGCRSVKRDTYGNCSHTYRPFMFPVTPTETEGIGGALKLTKAFLKNVLYFDWIVTVCSMDHSQAGANGLYQGFEGTISILNI